MHVQSRKLRKERIKYIGKQKLIIQLLINDDSYDFCVCPYDIFQCKRNP